MTPPPESHYADGAGVRYHYHDLGSGPDTVFLHGGGPGCTAWSDFGPVAPLFAADRRCLLVDIHQYGKSEKSRITGPMWDHHADKTAGLLDTLGVDRADFVCNSWGGTIALNFAAHHPDRVRSLVITGSMPVFHGPLAPLPENGHRGRTARDVYYGGEGPTREKMRRLITSLEWYDADALPEETLDLRYRQSLDEGERELAAMSDSPRGDWQDLSGVLPRIQAPALFLWGMYDAFLTPDYPLMLARMLPRGSLHVMDRASHHPQEERPGAYHSVVSGFLDSVG
ncbi:alpha/beta fold hydrolase [Amycolatopsis jiangsuensis]|uniref:Pimeloyl-ACP methyl ester carboxylesterase n=1 Tax=Amycolatopsis jiangsuensis TaxID=1181879 RepID=A0A840IPU4_9PSEU|nr:alpha/beta hydrolase [Amycolatopsis jiangsuensis]MBB4683883.1 pimeloyl-ACP methyl ester carboxylesterase [Amycolatopsis jiangsuensis]